MMRKAISIVQLEWLYLYIQGCMIHGLNLQFQDWDLLQ